MPSPDIVKKADALYIESTYGDRNHRTLEASIEEFKQAITDTLNNQGNVMIPSFAIERTQEILVLLKQMYYDQELPPCKVYLDSPMAIRATEIYNRYHNDLNESANRLFQRDGSVFDFPYLEYTLTGEDSIRINDEESGCIIIAGSGMSELFGGFSDAFYAGYNEVFPLDRDYAKRKPLYNLYHILNHYNLFGGHYAQQAQGTIEQLLQQG